MQVSQYLSSYRIYDLADLTSSDSGYCQGQARNCSDHSNHDNRKKTRLCILRYHDPEAWAILSWAT